MLTDGDIALPIDLSFWTSSEVNPFNYRKKTDIAREIIKKINALIYIKVVVMDGLYCDKEMICWLKKKEISFEMRFHSNRVIIVNGQKYTIKKCPFFKLKRGRMERTIQGFWHDINFYFTAIKHCSKNGIITVFQVSNYKTSAKQHRTIYKHRLNIEKFFRTAKQHLDLNDCQSPKKEKQYNHILNVYLAYIVAQHERIKRKFDNVEMALKSIKSHNLRVPNYANTRLRGIFAHA